MKSSINVWIDQFNIHELILIELSGFIYNLEPVQSSDLFIFLEIMLKKNLAKQDTHRSSRFNWHNLWREDIINVVDEKNKEISKLTNQHTPL